MSIKMLFKDTDGNIVERWVTKEEKRQIELERKLERHLEISKRKKDIVRDTKPEVMKKFKSTMKKMNDELSEMKRKNKPIKEKYNVTTKKGGASSDTRTV